MRYRRPVETLSHRAVFLRESLHESQSITDDMVATLGSFDHCLSAFESAMRPSQLRTQAIRKAHQNIDKTLKSVDIILSRFDLSHQAEAKIMEGPHKDLGSYLSAVDQLMRNIDFFSYNKSFKSSDVVVSHTNELLARAIVNLEEEFEQLLCSHSKPVEPEHLFDCLPSSLQPSSESFANEGNSKGNATSKTNNYEHRNKKVDADAYKLPTLIPPRILPSLHDLAQVLVQSGCQQQCSRIYRESRAPILEQSLKELGVEKLSKEDVKIMQWEALEAKIGNWIHFMRITVKLLFAGERKVCDQIFEGITPLKEQCFAEVTANSFATLLSLGDAIAKSKRSPEELFVLLDMYEVMIEHKSEIEIIFEGKFCINVRKSTLSLLEHLAQTVRETFGDFEEAVEKDVTRTVVQDGTVHPLTSYVINYVKFLFDYQSTLKQIFQEFETKHDPNSQLSTITTRIMKALQSNLDGKSKQYKDPTLKSIFLMNNIHYMVRSVRRSEGKEFLGDDWVERHRRIVQQHANQYKRVAWAKVLQSISAQGLTSSVSGNKIGSEGSSGISRTAVKERLRSFNAQFEELHHRQSHWTVPDPELRESLRLSVAEVLLPAYGSFIKRFGPILESRKSPHKYVKYTPEDLDRMLGELFEGRQ